VRIRAINFCIYLFIYHGKTIHFAAMLRRSIIGIELSTEVDWTVTKVLIINEISMAGIDMFSKLDKHLQILTGNRHLLYGGIHIIFTGDVMQLAPVGDHLSSANSITYIGMDH